MNNGTLIAASEALGVLKQLPEGTSLEEKLRNAMKKTYRHWMGLDETEQFNAACVAVVQATDGDERARLEHELTMLRALSVMQTGVPVDFAALMTSAEAHEPIGVLKLWDEIKAAAA